MNRRFVWAIAVLMVVCVSGVSRAQAIPRVAEGIPRVAVYSVKFLCGFQPPIGPFSPATEPPVKPGNYATAINIHNFHTFPVTICKKAVLAPPERCIQATTREGCPPRLTPIVFPVTLGPNDAFEVDCRDIATTLLHGLPPPQLGGPLFIKGFVEIAVVPQFPILPDANPISVTGVYTSLGCVTDPKGISCNQLSGSGLEVVPESSFLGELPKECPTPTG